MSDQQFRPRGCLLCNNLDKNALQAFKDHAAYINQIDVPGLAHTLEAINTSNGLTGKLVVTEKMFMAHFFGTETSTWHLSNKN
jgi:hypothetical protein